MDVNPYLFFPSLGIFLLALVQWRLESTGYVKLQPMERY